VEVTVYVRDAARRRGIGHALNAALLGCLRVQGYRSVVAVIALPNPASIGLYEALGFEPIGVFPAVGYKLGAWHDVGWWRLELQDPGVKPDGPLTVEEASRLPGWPEAIRAGNDHIAS